MERKIGEIFEYNGEWYQCVKGDCTKCDFFIKRGCVSPLNTACSKRVRKDKQNVIFKKLEKVGEPYEYFVQHKEIVMLQPYKLFATPFINGVVCNVHYDTNTIDLEIKQTKEDMEDLDKIKVRDYTKVEELNVMEEKKLNLKPFDIHKAREGKPVCTKDGRKARIICFDRNDLYPIVALIECEDGKEIIGAYSKEGQTAIYEIKGTDLMMLPEKKEGWVNVYALNTCYSSKEEAEANIDQDYEHEYVRTVKIEWEE